MEKGPRLGAGGFGDVFSGTGYIYNTKKDIALKTSQKANDPIFKREIEMFKKLKKDPHLFIVQVFGIVSIDKTE